MAIDVNKLEDHAIRGCNTADDARSVLWFFAAVRDALNAPCTCKGREVAEVIQQGQNCWPCRLRAGRDREED
jgi:hypothetical protein